jgi:hypothetical protein
MPKHCKRKLQGKLDSVLEEVTWVGVVVEINNLGNNYDN